MLEERDQKLRRLRASGGPFEQLRASRLIYGVYITTPIGIALNLMKTGHIKKGSILSVKVGLHGKSEQTLTGICIKKINKGFNSSFTIKHIVNNE